MRQKIDESTQSHVKGYSDCNSVHVLTVLATKVQQKTCDISYRFAFHVLLRRYKLVKIRKRCNQKKIPTPKTEVGKNQTNNQVLIPRKILSRFVDP